MLGSGNIVTWHYVFTSADKTLAVEDVRQFDTYEDGMISYHAWSVTNIILVMIAILLAYCIISISNILT